MRANGQGAITKRFCTGCGAALAEDSNFCGSCGKATAQNDPVYNNLPELGKIRVDAQRAEQTLGLAAGGAAALIVASSLINPVLGILSSAKAIKYVRRVWEKSNEKLAETEERRAEALGPEAVIMLIRERQQYFTQKLRNRQNTLRKRAKRRTRDYPICFAIIFTLITLSFFFDQPPGFKPFSVTVGETLAGFWLFMYLLSLPIASKERKDAEEIAGAIRAMCDMCDERVNSINENRQLKSEPALIAPTIPPLGPWFCNTCGSPVTPHDSHCEECGTFVSGFSGVGL